MSELNGSADGAAISAGKARLVKEFAAAINSGITVDDPNGRLLLYDLLARIDDLETERSEGPLWGDKDQDELFVRLDTDAQEAGALETMRLQVLARINAPRPPAAVLMSEVGPPAARQWLIEDWLPRGRIGMLSAVGGFGKSRLALQLAAAMTTGGGDWLPRSIHDPMPTVGAGIVVFATWEDEPAEFARRIGQERAAAMQDCHIVDLARFGPLWGTSGAGNERAGLLPPGAWLRAYCEDVGADLLIVDSLAGAYGANENDRGQVREFMADWDGWGRAADCAVMLISHPSKTPNAAYSGSTDWHSASRWRWIMETEEKSKRHFLHLDKTNYSQDGRRVYIERGGRDKGFDWCQSANQSGDEGEHEGTRKEPTNEV